MTVPDELRQPLARLYLATEWVAGLPMPAEAPDDFHRDFDGWRIYCRDVRRVAAARDALRAVLDRSEP